MARVTYFAALPFMRDDDGELVAGEAKECQTASAAVRAAERQAFTAAGAVSFSRTGDPAVGEFDEAELIKAFGEVPTLDVP